MSLGDVLIVTCSVSQESKSTALMAQLYLYVCTLMTGRVDGQLVADTRLGLCGTKVNSVALVACRVNARRMQEYSHDLCQLTLQRLETGSECPSALLCIPLNFGMQSPRTCQCPGIRARERCSATAGLRGWPRRHNVSGSHPS
jgi:hypothetical protein